MKIQVQTNIFNAQQKPTTQEDNFGQIKERWDLFHIYHHENNGNKDLTKVGALVEYFDGSYAVFHGAIRYDLPSTDITKIS